MTANTHRQNSKNNLRRKTISAAHKGNKSRLNGISEPTIRQPVQYNWNIGIRYSYWIYFNGFDNFYIRRN